MSSALSRVLDLQRLALPLTAGQLAFAANGFVTHYCLARSSAAAFHASLPGSMLAIAISSVFISTLGYSGTILAHLHGKGDVNGANGVFRHALALTLASIPLFIVALPLGHRILAVFDTIPEVLAAESTYFDILLANGFFTALAAVLGGYFTGRGKTRLVGLTTTLGFALNMALSPLFIGGFLGVGGVAGAGWAATIAHIVPCIVLAARIEWRALPARGESHDLLSLGLPNGIRSLIDIGGFFVFVALLAECPPAAVAASTAAFAVNGIYQALPQGLAAAVEIATARGKCGTVGSALVVAGAYLLVFLAVLYLFGPSVLQFFLPENAPFSVGAFTAAAKPLLTILGLKAAFESTTCILQSFLKGKGDTKAVFAIQFLASCCFWIPLYLIVKRTAPSIPNYWLTMTACSILSTFLLTCRSRRPGLRKDRI